MGTRVLDVRGQLWPAAILLAGLSLSSTALAQEPAAKPERAGGPFGVGFVLGDTDGVSLKYWAGQDNAFQLRLGSTSHLNSVGLTATFAHHFRPVQVADGTFSLPFYVGGGGRFKIDAADTDDTYLDGGVVGLVGMSVLVPDLPVELFVELTPVVAIYNDDLGVSNQVKVGFVVEGGMGIHYYF